ncbi:class I lanthipeptide [Flavobacterium sp. LAR06]
MKKTETSNKLAFNKMAITELNDSQIQEINGGTDYLKSISITIYILTLI